jgi:hypothetical protein
VSLQPVEHFATFFVQYQGGDCSKSQFKKILDFMQDYINQNLFAGNHAHQCGLVCNHTVVKSINKTLGKAEAKIANELNLDVHAGLNLQLTRRKKSWILFTCVTSRANQALEQNPSFCSATQTCQRSQDLGGNQF